MYGIEPKETRKGWEYWIHCAGRPRGLIDMGHDDVEARALLEQVRAELAGHR